MATDQHLQLSAFIRKVHQDLRVNSRHVGPEEAWKNHCKKHDLLKEYAHCMQQLATEHWESTKREEESRIVWVVKQCQHYFFEEEYKQEMEKEIMLKSKLEQSGDVLPCVDVTSIIQDSSSKLKLLDVGSCYNPFHKYSQFVVTAIDLSPATPDVLKCDFLNVDIVCKDSVKKQTVTGQQITSLPSSSFHVVVFSLLLEYLPSPEQRLLCCEKAYELLTTNGLLFIITPDSKHPSANARAVKRWKIALSLLGFRRIYYEKLTHLHCMAFRKCVFQDVVRQWAEHQIDILEKRGMSTDVTLTIPQDSNWEESVQNNREERTSGENEELCCLFSQLPDIY